MEKIDINQIDRDIQDGRFDWDKLEKLPYPVYQELSSRYAEREYDRLAPIAASSPRDWFKMPDVIFIGGLMGETHYVIPYMLVSQKEGEVRIHTYQVLADIFTSRRKLDSFIEALVQARDEAFPQ